MNYRTYRFFGKSISAMYRRIKLTSLLYSSSPIQVIKLYDVCQRKAHYFRLQFPNLPSLYLCWKLLSKAVGSQAVLREAVVEIGKNCQGYTWVCQKLASQRTATEPTPVKNTYPWSQAVQAASGNQILQQNRQQPPCEAFEEEHASRPKLTKSGTTEKNCEKHNSVFVC
jgi:hypothetical protein